MHKNVPEKLYLKEQIIKTILEKIVSDCTCDTASRASMHEKWFPALIFYNMAKK